jgi:ribonuclease D
MNTNQKTYYVETSTQLAECLKYLAQHQTVAVDTEFIRERTYYPKLCLIQLAAGDRIWCIDTIAIGNNEVLFDALNSPNLVKIFHSARQDLELFFNQAQQLPTPLFDTQIAAALVGRPDQIAYAGLVAEFYSLDLDKSSSRTDWTRRPLSTRQLEYAADDVRYLEGVKRYLEDELVQRGRESWLSEECIRLSDVDLYNNDPAQAWRKLKGIEKLEYEQLSSAVSLASWRERLAQQRDLPRGWVLKDDRILAVVRAAPSNLADLARIEGISPSFIRRDGEGMLEASRHENATPVMPDTVLLRKMTSAGKALVRELLDALKTAASDHDVSSTLIATRREIESAIAGRKDIRFYTGWRCELFGQLVLSRISESTKNLSSNS